jgi:hypothetical protein
VLDGLFGENRIYPATETLSEPVYCTHMASQDFITDAVSQLLSVARDAPSPSAQDNPAAPHISGTPFIAEMSQTITEAFQPSLSLFLELRQTDFRVVTAKMGCSFIASRI